MPGLKQLVAIQRNSSAGTQEEVDKRTFVIWCESFGQVVTILLACVCLCVSIRAMGGSVKASTLGPC